MRMMGATPPAHECSTLATERWFPGRGTVTTSDDRTSAARKSSSEAGGDVSDGELRGGGARVAEASTDGGGVAAGVVLAVQVEACELEEAVVRSALRKQNGQLADEPRTARRSPSPRLLRSRLLT